MKPGATVELGLCSRGYGYAVVETRGYSRVRVRGTVWVSLRVGGSFRPRDTL